MENTLHGNVFEIPLLKELGFAYVRLINPDLLLGKSTSSILVEVFNCIEKNPSNDRFEISLLTEVGFIMPPLIMLPFTISLKKYGWRLVGNVPVEEGYIIPDYALCSNKTLGKPERYSLYSWEIVKNLGLDRPHRKTTFLECNGLGIYQHLSCDLIVVRITMEWMKLQEMRIRDYFDKDDFSKPWYKVMYNQTVNLNSKIQS